MRERISKNLKDKGFTPLEVTGQTETKKVIKPLTGFTLIEMLIVITIFSIMVTVLIGIFVSSLRNYRYYLGSQQLLDQSNYALEYMGRIIRMARKATDNSCISKGTSYEPAGFPFGETTNYVKFINYRGQCQRFYLDNNRVYQEIIGQEALAMTSDDVKIKRLKFYVSGASEKDDFQPRVTIFLEGEAINSIPRPKIKLQTTVSQRNLDI